MWGNYRLTFGLQGLSTLAIAALSGWFAGLHGVLSALLGGAVSVAAGLGFVALASRKKTAGSAGEALYGALRAEAVKIVLTLFLLVLVFALYKQVVAVALIGTFIVTVVIFSVVPWMGTQSTDGERGNHGH